MTGLAGVPLLSFLNTMPQFDIASFFPQITFFAGIFLVFYILLTKIVLPKIGQNLKLNKKLGEVYSTFSVRGLKDTNLLSFIYNPSKIVSYLIYRETTCLIFLQKFVSILTVSYVSSLNWLVKTHQKDQSVHLYEINKIYFKTLDDVYGSSK